MAERFLRGLGPDWSRVEEGLRKGIREKVCTAVSLLVGGPGRVLFHKALGRTHDGEGAREVGPGSGFDLASLTKPLATVPACLALVEEGLLELERPLGRDLELAPHLARLTPAHLLAHTSGLPAWKPFYKELMEVPYPQKTAVLTDLLNRTALEYRPGASTLYSDLGFMLLQLLVERITGLSLAEFAARRFYEPLGLDLGFIPLPDGPGPARGITVASEHCPWREKLLQGEVNDENAYAMGGIGGQAGLFGTAESVFLLLEWLLEALRGRSGPGLLSPATAGLILTNPFPGQPRTLGFDRPAPENSSAGDLFTARAIGHLGFTGTSLWADPKTGLTVILLTNRTIYGRDNLNIRQFRPLIHNLIREALGQVRGRPGA